MFQCLSEKSRNKTICIKSFSRGERPWEATFAMQEMAKDIRESCRANSLSQQFAKSPNNFRHHIFYNRKIWLLQLLSQLVRTVTATGYCKWLLQLVTATGNCNWLLRPIYATRYCKQLLQCH